MTHRLRASLVLLATALWAAGSAVPHAAVAAERLDLSLQEVELPGPPVEIFVTDLDGDGISDLVVLVAYTTWSQITTSDQVRMDQVDGLVEMMTVVPALADHRELFFLRGLERGGFEEGERGITAGWPIPEDVVTFFAGPSWAPVLALDSKGLVALELEDDGPRGARLGLRRLLSEPSVLADVAELLPGLSLSHDVDGDGELDLLYPRTGALDVYLGSEAFASSLDGPDGVVFLPGREELELAPRRMHYPLPRFRDLDGDGLEEMILLHPSRRLDDPWISTNLGGGAFGPLQRPMEDWREEGGANSGSVVYLGDLDGDGDADAVSEEELAAEEGRFREDLREAKEPPYRYRIHSLGPDYRPGDVEFSFLSTGYAFGAESGGEFPLPGGLRDLDGDGRLDLVTITLDFSLMQVVRIMVTQTISIGLDFHIRCQQEDGSFRLVEGLDLSGKFKLSLDDLQLGQLSQFAGDFDGDGRADFVQLGRGRKVSIHRGGRGCSYPERPDLTLRLQEEPRNLSLVRVDDYDGDERADLIVVQPRSGRGRTRTADSDASTLPVTLEMHLSRKGRRP